MNNEKYICERCGKEFSEDWRKDKEQRKRPIRFCSRSCANAHTPSSEHIEKVKASVTKFCKESTHRCQYCKQACKDNISLQQHEQNCKHNPTNLGDQKSFHTRHYYTRPMRLKKDVILNVTKAFVDQYKKEHPVCEICGRTVEEVVKTKSRFGPHSLCVDHDHTTNKFRGLLCAVCNRQLGWYEKNKDAIDKYLNKEDL